MSRAPVAQQSIDPMEWALASGSFPQQITFRSEQIGSSVAPGRTRRVLVAAARVQSSGSAFWPCSLPMRGECGPRDGREEMEMGRNVEGGSWFKSHFMGDNESTDNTPATVVKTVRYQSSRDIK